jgi:hypothetical protein
MMLVRIGMRYASFVDFTGTFEFLLADKTTLAADMTAPAKRLTVPCSCHALST